MNSELGFFGTDDECENLGYRDTTCLSAWGSGEDYVKLTSLLTPVPRSRLGPCVSHSGPSCVLWTSSWSRLWQKANEGVEME